MYLDPLFHTLLSHVAFIDFFAILFKFLIEFFLLDICWNPLVNTILTLFGVFQIWSLFFRSPASPQVSSRGSSPSSVRLTAAQRAASKSPLSADMTRQDSASDTSNLVSSLTRDQSPHESSPALSMRSEPIRSDSPLVAAAGAATSVVAPSGSTAPLTAGAVASASVTVTPNATPSGTVNFTIFRKILH